MSVNSRIWIGVSGWSYPDWSGTVYPRRRPRGFHALTFLSRLFRAVEVNTSFYAIPRPEHTSAWAERVPADFRFAVKLTRDFTHERDTFPSSVTVRRFREALRPLADAGKLGPLLIQFPWSFRFSRSALERVERIADAFFDVRRVIEVRHASWSSPQARKRLARLGAICNIDQPQLRDCLPPTDRADGPLAYVRLHGRNAGMWFAKDVPGYERYNYSYTEAELAEWVARLRAILAESREVYVFANNHYRGQGVANALELRAMLEGVAITPPPQLRATYPRLDRIAPPPAQQTLFDE
ncbi:MAG: DUF72 domain-containing protein [Planctomycetota bacterium]|nr:MAG: DUF72 domain-containing protein [Planctomycetota bacterium]